MAPGRGCEPRTGGPVHGGDSPCQETCARRDRAVWRASMHGIPNAGRLRTRVCVLEDFDEAQGACSMIGTLAFWKTAHILSAAVVFGTGLGIAFFCWFGYRHAMRDGDIGVLRGTLRLTVVADAWLTAPAVVFQAVSGVVLMTLLGWPLLSPWSIAVWSLFVFTGACCCQSCGSRFSKCAKRRAWPLSLR